MSKWTNLMMQCDAVQMPNLQLTQGRTMVGMAMMHQCGGMHFGRPLCRTGRSANWRAAHQVHSPAAQRQPALAAFGAQQHVPERHTCPLKSQRRSRTQFSCRAGSDEQQPGDNLPEPVAQIVRAVGEDAALFRLQDQSISAWGIFTMLLVGVLGALYAVRIRTSLQTVCD